MYNEISVCSLFLSGGNSALGSNPLYCDCSFRWFSEWIKTNYVEEGIASCSGPEPMIDKLVLTTASHHFVCREKITNEILAKCDICFTFPCQNGACRPLFYNDNISTTPLLLPDPIESSSVATASATTTEIFFAHGNNRRVSDITINREYECDCQAGYYGGNCEFKIDACYGNPCRNNGTCSVLEEGRFDCKCLPGYKGERCEQNIDDCHDHKCQNNGTCVEGIERYTCRCQPGFKGELFVTACCFRIILYPGVFNKHHHVYYVFIFIS